MFADTIQQGADYFVAILDKNPDGTATVITGCTARLQARRYPSAEVVDVDLTSTPAAGLTVTAGTGRIDVHLTATQTAALTGSYVVQLELTWPSGQVDRLLDGTWTVSDEVVR